MPSTDLRVRRRHDRLTWLGKPAQPAHSVLVQPQRMGDFVQNRVRDHPPQISATTTVALMGSSIDHNDTSYVVTASVNNRARRLLGRFILDVDGPSFQLSGDIRRQPVDDVAHDAGYLVASGRPSR